MTDPAEKARRFFALHQGETPLLMPNAWDAGSARVLVSLGFQAVATTSSGHAATLGRLDGSVSRDEALSAAAAIVAAVEVPVSADLENGFADDPAGVAETVSLAVEAGLAGCSVEDWSGSEIYDRDRAAERVAAAVEAAHSGPVPFVLTARAENLLHGHRDLQETIARLQAYQEAGADVLFAPGLSSGEQIEEIIRSVDRPVNVLVRPGLPAVAGLGEFGVSRISVGGSFAFNALGALVEAASELRDFGTYRYWERTAEGLKAAREAFGSP